MSLKGYKLKVCPNSARLSNEHDRYLVQAQWTAELRTRILHQITGKTAVNTLEVGSGTGAITQAIREEIDGRVYGVDIDPEVTKFAGRSDGRIHYAVADGHNLPFPDSVFDLVYAHFLLLWVRDPAQVLSEMARTVQPGGWVVAFAEPDYGGRIDYPETLERVGELQVTALEHAGASSRVGRRLRSLFSKLGLEWITAGVLGGEWHADLQERLTRSEWSTLRSDLDNQLTPEQLEHLESIDRSAWQEQTRVLFVPTFYAFGQVTRR